MVRIKEMIRLIFKAVSPAMGVAVIVMLIMNSVAIENAVLLLGIGLSCAGMASFIKTEHKDES